ncbi:glutamate-cysteine ligase family protein [Microbacterium esteraromaticum]|uniref:glutamate-cysteine ligase family protein n=1 Tax=Microbacterium esteraromaticum TaxID=57043 RepID=UPI0021753D3A|nr:glutamate-cysteine ligase family protein [Microbacterium esteraromaticum]
MDATRFGIEEEFLLLDASALVPLSGSEIVERVKGPAPGGGSVTSEYLTCQFECATDPVRTLEQAGSQLAAMRRMLADLAPRTRSSRPRVHRSRSRGPR